MADGGSVFATALIAYSLALGLFLGLSIGSANPGIFGFPTPGPSSSTTTYPISGPNSTFVFDESGLLAGVLWSVNVSCLAASSGPCAWTNTSGHGPEIKIVLPSDAVYTYAVFAPSWYSASPASGRLAGGEIAITSVSFTNTAAAQASANARENASWANAEFFLWTMGAVFVSIGWYLRASRPYEVDGYPVEFDDGSDVTFCSGPVPTYDVESSFGVLGRVNMRRAVRVAQEGCYPDGDPVEVDVVLPWWRGRV